MSNHTTGERVPPDNSTMARQKRGQAGGGLDPTALRTPCGSRMSLDRYGRDGASRDESATQEGLCAMHQALTVRDLRKCYRCGLSVKAFFAKSSGPVVLVNGTTLLRCRTAVRVWRSSPTRTG